MTQIDEPVPILESAVMTMTESLPDAQIGGPHAMTVRVT